MVAILAVGEVIVREIGTGENDFVVKTVELDVLQPPPFVDALGDQSFAQSGQVRRVVHANLHLVGKFGRQRGEEGSTRCIGAFSRASQCVRQDGYFEPRPAVHERFPQRGDELEF